MPKFSLPIERKSKRKRQQQEQHLQEGQQLQEEQEQEQHLQEEQQLQEEEEAMYIIIYQHKKIEIRNKSAKSKHLSIVNFR